MPKAKTKEKSTITLSETPMASRIINDINIDRGMATPTNKAFLKPKKKSKTKTTSKTPKMIEFSKSETISRVLLL